MIIEPAIDLKDGKVVRLKKGDFDTVHQVAEDPVTVAKIFAAAGAKVIHMVDLDGAKSGARSNAAIVRQVAETSGMKIELGGGIRTMEDLEAVGRHGRLADGHRLRCGQQSRLCPGGSGPVWQPYCGGLRCSERGGQNRRWVEGSGVNYLDFARSMEKIGVKTLIFTDIATDGMLSGPAFASLEQLQKKVGCQIVASGGVSNNEDIRALTRHGAVWGHHRKGLLCGYH